MKNNTTNVRAAVNGQESMTAEQAMNTVLEAERNARDSVHRCKAEADALLLQARQKSQRIGKRVDDRITRIHQRVSRVVTDQVKLLEEEQRLLAKQENLYKVDNEIVAVVVEQIAEMLTTPITGDGQGE
jgi:vacuolar-type H+-ATPase subunit H